jgi:predicted nucleic acid-binding protein
VRRDLAAVGQAPAHLTDRGASEAPLGGQCDVERRGLREPGPINGWVAACCLDRELPLATLNVKDFVYFREHEASS